MTTKWFCQNCRWTGTEEEVLKAPNPFADDDTEQMWGCPTCREPNMMRRACDEKDCWSEGTCGTPTPQDYKHTCFEHRPDRAR